MRFFSASASQPPRSPFCWRCSSSLLLRRCSATAAGLIALGLIAFDPTLLAHSALMTTDAGGACFMFWSIYAFYRYAKSPSIVRLVVAGLVVGLALASKHSSVLLFPMLLLLAIVEVAWPRAPLPWEQLPRAYARALYSLSQRHSSPSRFSPSAFFGPRTVSAMPRAKTDCTSTRLLPRSSPASQARRREMLSLPRQGCTCFLSPTSTASLTSFFSPRHLPASCWAQSTRIRSGFISPWPWSSSQLSPS